MREVTGGSVRPSRAAPRTAGAASRPPTGSGRWPRSCRPLPHVEDDALAPLGVAHVVADPEAHGRGRPTDCGARLQRVLHPALAMLDRRSTDPRGDRRRGRARPPRDAGTAERGTAAAPAGRRLLDQLGGDLVEEPRRRVVLGAPCSMRHQASRQVQPLAGPGDADVGEAALLLELSGSPASACAGRSPSSIPIRNTTGNSRPLAECSVISTTRRCRRRSSSLVGVGHEADLLEELLDRLEVAGVTRPARPGSRAGPRPRSTARPRARRGSRIRRAPSRAGRPGPRRPRCRASSMSLTNGSMPRIAVPGHLGLVLAAQRLQERDRRGLARRRRAGRRSSRRRRAWARSGPA